MSTGTTTTSANKNNSHQKIAVVTGANKGLGFGTALALAEKGFHTMLVGRDKDRIEKACAQLRDQLKDQSLSVESFCADVTNEKQVDELVTHLKNKFGKLDVLVNNAGVIIEGHVATDRSATLPTVSAETVLKTFEINTLGAYIMIQKLLPLLQKSGAARVVNVSSGMGQLSEMEGGFPAYRISKTALNAVTCLTHAEFGGESFKINSVCPGWVRTDMGGENAHRSIEEGIRGIVWAATLPADGPSGGNFRDGQRLDW